MKNIVVLYAGSISDHAFDKYFDEKSAFDISLEWAGRHGEKTIILCNEKNSQMIGNILSSGNLSHEILSKPSWTNSDVISAVADSCKKYASSFAVFSWADTPFLNDGLTDELVKIHEEYLAEYSFADGYPYGVSPEIIDSGSANIISILSKDLQKAVGEKPASRDGIFSVMKGDINSFEIETLISDTDYRMMRLELECSRKINGLACRNLWQELKKNGKNFKDSEVSLSKVDFQNQSFSLFDLPLENVIRTLPAFYNIQITSRTNHKIAYNPDSPLLYGEKSMKFEDFRNLVERISEFSESAVVSLSCFGEPLLHENFSDFVNEVLKYENLSVLVETDGILLNEKILSEIKDDDSSKNRINWIILLDAMDSNLYSTIHSCPESDFSVAVNAVPLLEGKFPGHVYPQFVRMNMNEDFLEGFYRFWKEKENPSHGNLIIQKYDHFCGLLPDEKSADLSPLNRNPCWHLRRDMVVLWDGTVPVCRDLFDSKIGNVFEESLETIWEKNREVLKAHLDGNYSEKCKACDEYYTFIF